MCLFIESTPRQIFENSKTFCFNMVHKSDKGAIVHNIGFMLKILHFCGFTNVVIIT